MSRWIVRDGESTPTTFRSEKVGERMSSDEQVDHDEKDAEPRGDPADRAHAWRREGVCRNINDPGDDELPGSEVRQHSRRMSRMHEEQRGDELRKYLEQVAMGSYEAAADSSHLPRCIAGPRNPSPADLTKR